MVAEAKRPNAELLEPSRHLSKEKIKQMLNAQRRLTAYRALVFWTYPDIRRGERRALPSCVYSMVRAAYPPTEDEEYADWEHSVYVSDGED